MTFLFHCPSMALAVPTMRFASNAMAVGRSVVGQPLRETSRGWSARAGRRICCTPSRPVITAIYQSSLPLHTHCAWAIDLAWSVRPVRFAESVQDSILSVLTEHYVELGHELSPAMPIPRFARFAEWNLKKKKTIACSTCRNYFAVDQNAQVASCQMTLDKPFGSLKTDALTEIVERVRSAPETRLLAIPSLT